MEELEFEEGWLRVECISCGSGWWMDYEPSPTPDCCGLDVVRLGVVIEGVVEWGVAVGSEGREWKEDG